MPGHPADATRERNLFALLAGDALYPAPTAQLAVPPPHKGSFWPPRRFPDTPACSTPTSRCQAALRAVRDAFNAEYAASSSGFEPRPLLRLRLNDALPAFECVV